jgi:carbamoyltransferase
LRLENQYCGPPVSLDQFLPNELDPTHSPKPPAEKEPRWRFRLLYRISMKNILGVSAYFHDSACCLLQDGELIAAAQEERFSRRKHDPSLPVNSFRYCLRQGNITISDIDCIAYYENPFSKLHRQIWHRRANLDKETLLGLWRSAMRPEEEIRNLLGYRGPLYFAEHHRSHAASAYFFSGFHEAAVLTVDGVGEWATTTYGRANHRDLQVFEEVHFPHSLGLFYSAITGYLGFGVNDGEYKVMGLAPYGSPRVVERVWRLIDAMDQGQFRLDLEFFDLSSTERMYSDQLMELLGGPQRESHEPILQRHCDIARSVQQVLEEVLVMKVKYLHDRVPVDSLCMAGGVALNCVANAQIKKKSPFKHFFVQPAAGDAGTSLGAAALALCDHTNSAPHTHQLQTMYLGPGYTADEIARVLRSTGLPAEDYRDREDHFLSVIVDLLVARKVVGWFQGRMEFGPRALGARSILADPRDPRMCDRINSVVKKRESFRPFAPAVLESEASRHFDIDGPSPFMLQTCQVSSSISLAAITHIDGSARVQTVNLETNGRFARLLELFAKRTGCPILLNTSFNMANEPIVCSPHDALLCFSRSEIDVLAMEDFLLLRGDLDRRHVATLRSLELPRPAVNDRIYVLD